MKLIRLFVYCIFALVFTSCESGFDDMMNEAIDQYFTITYNANGGTGTVPVDSATYLASDTFIAKANTLTNGIYNFIGWNTQPNGSGIMYSALSAYPIGKSNLILYAQWAASPTVTTNVSSTGIAGTSSTWGGEVSSDGGSVVTERGLCWSTTVNPTTANSKVQVGTGTGTFTGTITSLTINTTYHVRAYAINSQGTVYGSDISFNSGRTYGSTYSGGSVFYNDGSGHGLVAGTASATNMWTPLTSNIGIPSTSYNVGTGSSNTANIISLFGAANAPAANFCDVSTEGGYTDWYLPSMGELELMTANINAGWGSWSSTTSGFAGASYYVYTGSQAGVAGNTAGYRNATPVRSF